MLQLHAGKRSFADFQRAQRYQGERQKQRPTPWPTRADPNSMKRRERIPLTISPAACEARLAYLQRSAVLAKEKPLISATWLGRLRAEIGDQLDQLFNLQLLCHAISLLCLCRNGGELICHSFENGMAGR